MSEPASSAAAGVAGWKLVGGLTGLAAGGAGFAAFLSFVVVMCMRMPRNTREWAVGLISTLVSSIGGGAYLVHWLGLSDLASTGVVGLAVLFGLCFLAGLPGWALVRAAFTWLERREGKDLGELATDVADTARKAVAP